MELSMQAGEFGSIDGDGLPVDREPAPPGSDRASATTVSRGATQVVVFASQKGGTGKTTLCGHVAVQAALANLGPVALIDTDPQGSLAAWWNARKAESPLFVRTSVTNLTRDIEALERDGMRFVFIDTPPRITNEVRQVVRHADLVVVPTRPSPHDLRALGPTLDMIEDYSLPLVFVVNGASLRARITGETCVALSQHGTVSPVVVHQRTDFATSMIDGRTVMEVRPDTPAAAEIGGVWSYLEGRLGRIHRRGQRLAKVSASRHVFAAGTGDQPGFGRRTVEGDRTAARA
jgi:chromosome partitioning protein